MRLCGNRLLVMVRSLLLAKDTSLSPLSLVPLLSPCGPTTPSTLSLMTELKSPITMTSPFGLVVTLSRSE